MKRRKFKGDLGYKHLSIKKLNEEAALLRGLARGSFEGMFDHHSTKAERKEFLARAKLREAEIRRRRRKR